MTGDRFVAGSASPPSPVHVVVLAVAVHVALTLGHGFAHATIPVPIADWQAVYTAVVLIAAPIAGAALAVRGRLEFGAWLVLAAGLAALAFEGVLHFVVANPDHVAAVDGGVVAFAGSAVVSTASDALIVLASGWALRRQAQGSSSSSAIESTA